MLAKMTILTFLLILFVVVVYQCSWFDSNRNRLTCNQHECRGHSVEKNDVVYCTWQLQVVGCSSDTVQLLFLVELSAMNGSAAPTPLATERQSAPRKKNDIQCKKTNVVELFEDADVVDCLEEVIKAYKS
jgi:hypothetical protein